MRTKTERSSAFNSDLFSVKQIPLNWKEHSTRAALPTTHQSLEMVCGQEDLKSFVCWSFSFDQCLSPRSCWGGQLNRSLKPPWSMSSKNSRGPSTNVERSVSKLSFRCSRCTQHIYLSRSKRLGQDCRNHLIHRHDEEHESCCERSFLLDDALCWTFELVSNDGNPTCPETRKYEGHFGR